MSLRPLTHDLSIFNKLELERPPIGIKYEFFEPEGVEKLNKSVSLCEMIPEAQRSTNPFYISRQNEDCAGKCALGMMEGPKWGEAGEIGERLHIFQDGRANRNCNAQHQTFQPGTVNFAVFSRLDRMSFEPDLMVFVGQPEQAEIVLRAMAYSTGQMYESKGSPVLQCSWLYVYPVISQQVNFMLTAMSFGMRARQVYPSGLVIVSVPWNWIPTIAENMREMDFVLPAWKLGRQGFMEEEARLLEGIDNKAKEMNLRENAPFTSFRS